MAKLILEEGGARRAFRVRSGKLTIGSADSCTLTLASSGVAEHHATLVVQEDRAVLQTTAGEEPPLVNGKPAAERQELPARCTIAIGGALLEYEAEGAAEEAAAPARSAPASGAAKRPAVRKQAGASSRPAAGQRSSAGGGRGAARPSGARRSAARDEGDGEDGSRRVSSRRREVKQGMPTWALILLLLVGAGGVAFGVKAFFDSSNVATVDPSVQLLEAANALKGDQLKAVEHHLDKFDAHKDKATSEQIAKAAEIRKQLGELQKASTRQGVLSRATDWMNNKLIKFEDQKMAGNLGTRPRARVFVMRCNEFIELYPDHPEIDWVRRKKDRWAPVAKMEEPRTLEDLQFEVETYTWVASGRRYDLVFEAIDEYLAHADGPEAEVARSLREEKLAERRAHHVDRMQEIRYRWEKGETGKAMAHFVYHLKWWGDEEMENEVAQEISRLGGFDEWLVNFKKSSPEDFAIIVQNRYVREAAERNGLL